MVRTIFTHCNFKPFYTYVPSSPKRGLASGIVFAQEVSKSFAQEVFHGAVGIGRKMFKTPVVVARLDNEGQAPLASGFWHINITHLSRRLINDIFRPAAALVMEPHPTRGYRAEPSR